MTAERVWVLGEEGRTLRVAVQLWDQMETDHVQLVALLRATRAAVDNWEAPRAEIVAVLDRALGKLESQGVIVKT